jgi:hypothetical protein
VCYVLLYVRTRKVWRYQKDNHTGTVNRKKENLMTKRKQTKGQTMIYKTLHRQRNTLIINNSIKIRKRTQVLWEGKQFLLHQWHLLCLLVVCILFYCITSTHMLLSYIFKNITWTTNKSSAVLDNRVMVLNTTYNYISVISWRSVFYWWKNRSIRKQPPTSSKSLTNFIT